MRSSRAVFGIVFALTLALSALGAGRGFRTPHLLDEHFAKYGPGFGKITKLEYLHMAQLLRDERPGKYILESRRRDGGGAKFDRKRGWFVAYDPDGCIRTFFVPRDGLRYFAWQARTGSAPE